MPSKDYVSLCRIGPAKSLDSTTCPEFMAEGDGAVVSNAATYRYTQGLSTVRGRQQIVSLSNFSNYQVGAVVPYANTPTDQQYLLSLTKPGSSPNVIVYDPVTQAQPLGSIANSSTFTHGVQFYNTIYTNAGQQYSALNPGNMYAWQYPQPVQTTQNYSVASGNGTLPAGTYYYAFTQVVQGPNGAFTQETTPLGALPTQGPPPPATLYPYAVTSTGANGAAISGIFTGTTSDGATYTTNLYRQSTNVPVWYLVANLATNATYYDSVNDSQIQANQQLLLNQDPPPVTAGNLGYVFIHQERIFCFCNVQNANTNNYPQTQLWYSDLGTPWRFNQVAQQAGGSVLLVGNSATPGTASYLGYGDDPVFGVSLGGEAILFKSRSMWVLYGNSPDTYFVSSLVNQGAMSFRSVITALGQVWWLSEFGAFTYGGEAPVYLSEKIQMTLDAIPYSDRCNAVSFFENMTWYISFPATNITLGYRVTEQTWHTIPYATNAAAFIPGNPRTFQGAFSSASGRPNEVVAARNGANALDWWFATEQDLGAPVTATWQSPLMSSGRPQSRKSYSFFTLLAPYQPGTVNVTVSIDPGGQEVKQWQTTINLAPVSGQTTTSHTFRISPDLHGYLAQITLTYTNTSTQTTPLVIYRADVWGTYDTDLTIPV